MVARYPLLLGVYGIRIGGWARKDGVDAALRGFREQRRAVRPHHQPPSAVRGSHDRGWKIKLVRELCRQGHRLHLRGEQKKKWQTIMRTLAKSFFSESCRLI